MRPTDTMTTASVGYHSTGTGLEIGFAAISGSVAAAARRRQRLCLRRRQRLRLAGLESESPSSALFHLCNN